MKVLVVSSQDLLRSVISGIISTTMAETATSDHENALEAFLMEEPTAVVVCEYEERGDGKEEHNRGKITYRDIKNSADEDVVVIRVGFSDYDYEDYLKVPFPLPELFDLLRIPYPPQK